MTQPRGPKAREKQTAIRTPPQPQPTSGPLYTGDLSASKNPLRGARLQRMRVHGSADARCGAAGGRLLPRLGHRAWPGTGHEHPGVFGDDAHTIGLPDSGHVPDDSGDFRIDRSA